MSSAAQPFSPSSLERLPGEPARPPLRLLERQPARARASARVVKAGKHGWLSRLQRALFPGA